MEEVKVTVAVDKIMVADKITVANKDTVNETESLNKSHNGKRITPWLLTAMEII